MEVEKLNGGNGRAEIRDSISATGSFPGLGQGE